MQFAVYSRERRDVRGGEISVGTLFQDVTFRLSSIGKRGLRKGPVRRLLLAHRGWRGQGLGQLGRGSLKEKSQIPSYSFWVK